MKKKPVFLVCIFLLVFLSGCAYIEEQVQTTPPAIRGFLASAFSSEYGDENRDWMIRWEIPLCFSLSGEYNQQDAHHLMAFIDLLGEQVPALPPLFLSDKNNPANVKIHFISKDEIPSLVPAYVTSNQGFFTYEYQNFLIIKGAIYIDSGLVIQQERDGVVEEEIINLLGLCNDIDFLPESILYSGSPKPYSASQTDYDMLRILYHPSLAPGMSKQDALQALRDIKLQ